MPDVESPTIRPLPPGDADGRCATAEALPPWKSVPGSTGEPACSTSPGRLRAGLLERLACPTCHTKLRADGDRLCCASCGQEFPAAADGAVPILFSPKSEFAACAEQYAAWRPAPASQPLRSYRGGRWLPRTSVSARLAAPWESFLRAVENKWVLNTGSGPHLVRSNLKHCVNLDICPHGNVDVIGDAHWLPFADASFDGAIYQAVFAHLRNPFQAAAEIIRVLKPGGLVWCTAPYAHPLSLAPRDYFRFSADGLRAIFDGLTVVELTACGGSFRVISRFAENTVDALLPGKVGSAARLAVAWSLQPFKYLDDWLVQRNPGCASAFFIVAQKPPV